MHLPDGWKGGFRLSIGLLVLALINFQVWRNIAVYTCEASMHVSSA